MPTLHIRFGDSVAETMSEIGKRGSQNDHALRDLTVKIPWLGKTTLGPSGFRFERIDNVDRKIPAELSQVHAILTLRDVPYVGSFKCSDERLNKIWETGAYTVHLNMQEYLWDGINRDMLVWLGDMHPEVSVINAVFGYNEVRCRGSLVHRKGRIIQHLPDRLRGQPARVPKPRRLACPLVARR